MDCKNCGTEKIRTVHTPQDCIRYLRENLKDHEARIEELKDFVDQLIDKVDI